MPSQILLLFTRNFLPLFVTQFFGAFNDNLLKTFLVVLIAYGLWDTGGYSPAVVVSFAAAVFIIPFILFTPFAGAVSDKWPKDKVVRSVKIAEIGVVSLAIAALYSESLIFAFFVLFLLAAQSAFFTPAKFALLPQNLETDQLVAGNAWMSAGTFLAILGGTVTGALLAPMENSYFVAAIILLICAFIGYGASRFIPHGPASDPTTRLRNNPISQIRDMVKTVFDQPAGVMSTILGVSWFYFVAATFHAQFPNYASQTLGVDNIVLTVMMVVFSVGVSIGALMNNVLLKSVACTRFVPWAGLVIALFTIDLYNLSPVRGSIPADIPLIGLEAFMSSTFGLRITFDLFMISLMGGLYVVPLRAVMHERMKVKSRSRITASAGMMEALFILLSAVLATSLLSLGVYVQDLFMITAILMVPVSLSLYLQKSLNSKEGIL